MQLLPAGGLLDEGMGLFLRHALGRLFTSGVLKVLSFGLGLDDPGPLITDDLPLLIDPIAGILAAGPTLLMFDFGNDPVGK